MRAQPRAGRAGAITLAIAAALLAASPDSRAKESGGTGAPESAASADQERAEPRAKSTVGPAKKAAAKSGTHLKVRPGASPEGSAKAAESAKAEDSAKADKAAESAKADASPKPDESAKADESPKADASPTPDASPNADASPKADASRKEDASAKADASPTQDASPKAADASATQDASPKSADASPNKDASPNAADASPKDGEAPSQERVRVVLPGPAPAGKAGAKAQARARPAGTKVQAQRAAQKPAYPPLPAEVEQVLERARNDYPVLRTEQGEPILRSILERQKVLQKTGMYPSIAMVEAVADHSDTLRPRVRTQAAALQADAAPDFSKSFGNCRWVDTYIWSCK